MPVANNAPIAAVMQMVDDHLLTIVNTVAGVIANQVIPLVVVCFSIYLMIVLASYMRGASAAPISDLWSKLAGIGIITSLGLTINDYVDFVVPIVMNLGNDMVYAISQGTSGVGGSIEENITVLDQMLQRYMESVLGSIVDVQDISNQYGSGGYMMVAFAALIVLVAIVPFLVFAGALIIVAKAGAALIVAVGPMFFACAIFPATRRYFYAWVNAAVYYALLPIFITLIALVAINMTQNLFTEEQWASLQFADIFMAGVVHLLLIYLLKTCLSLAAALAGGGSGASGGIGASGGSASSSFTSRWGGSRGHAREAARAAAISRLNASGIKPG
jgi:type IV secretion system protein VirB6